MQVDPFLSMMAGAEFQNQEIHLQVIIINSIDFGSMEKKIMGGWQKTGGTMKLLALLHALIPRSCYVPEAFNNQWVQIVC